MAYYERLKNKYDRNVYCSPKEKEERFRKLLENQEISEQRDLYKCECRKERKWERELCLQNTRI